MGRESIRAFSYDREELTSVFASDYGKGAYHAEALFRQLYSCGNVRVSNLKAYAPAPGLAARVERDFLVGIPSAGTEQEDGGTRKYILLMSDSSRTESVLIPMKNWQTLCISSQVGCKRGCAFCETARMGLIRNLGTEEIISQWAYARFILDIAPRNIVYMGMGEPFDNFDSVIRSIRIFSDSLGAGIPKKRISISTSGHVDGIRQLSSLEADRPDEAWRTVHLAVSLNGSNDRVRNRLMPINRIWPMSKLKEALLDAPQSSIKDALYFEYVVIPGVNDGESHAAELVVWMDGLEAKVNIISYHPRNESPWEAPDEETMNRFHGVIRSAGRECRTRQSRGEGIEAACGMLGGQSRPGSGG